MHLNDTRSADEVAETIEDQGTQLERQQQQWEAVHSRAWWCPLRHNMSAVFWCIGASDAKVIGPLKLPWIAR